MPVVTNGFAGILPAGTTVTAANSGSGGTPFDVVGIGSGGTIVSATGGPHGGLCVSLEDTSAASTYLQWTSAGQFGAQTSIYFRLYVKASAVPGTSVRLFNATTGGGSVMSVYLTTAGKLSVSYGGAGTAYVTFTATCPLNAWYRIEGFALVSATVGQVSASLFTSNIDEAAPDETHTSAATLNTGTLSGTTTYTFGDSSALAMTSAVQFADVGLSSTGALGPTGPVSTAVSVTEFSTGTTPASAVSAPAPPGTALGDLLMIWVVSQVASMTFSVTAGSPNWTAVTAATGQNFSAQLLYKTADATDVALAASAGSYTVTASVLHCIAGIVVDAPGLTFDPGVPPTSSGQLLAAAAATTFPVTGVTTLNNGDLLLFFGGQRGNPSLSVVPPAGFGLTGPMLSSTASAAVNVGVLLGTQSQALAGATGTETGVLGGAGGDGGGLLLALTAATHGPAVVRAPLDAPGLNLFAPPASPSRIVTAPAAGGTTAQAGALLAGSGSLTSAQAQLPGVLLAGTGTATEAASWPSAVALSGSGALTGVSGRGVSVTLSGSGTLQPGPVLQPGAVLSGSGTLSAAVAQGPGATLNGSGALAAGAQQAPGAALAGSGVLSEVVTTGPPVLLSGSGTMLAGPGYPGAALLAGSGALTAPATQASAVLLSGSGTLAAFPASAGAALLAGAGSLTMSLASAGAALLTGSGTLAASPALAGAALLSGTGALVTAASQLPAVLLSGSGVLAAAQVQLPGALLAGTGTLSAAAAQQPGALLLTGTGALSASTALGSAVALAGAGALTTSLGQQPGALLSGAGVLSAAAVQRPGALLSGTGTLSGAVRQGPGLALAGSGALTAGGALSAGVLMSGTGSMAPVPGTFWMSNSSYITSLYGADPATTKIFFDSPLAFSIGTSESAPGSVPSGYTTTPVLKYIAYGQLLADVTGSSQVISGVTYTPAAISGSYQWLMYDVEDWSPNPPTGYSTAAAQAEIDDPWTYMGYFVALAHAHGYKVILAPARDLGNDPTSVNPLGAQTLDQWYVSTNLAGTAAATGAEIVHVQTQADQGTGSYATFWASAYAQVRAAAGGAFTIVSAGVSTTSPGGVTAAQMAASAQSVAGQAEGFWLNTSTATISTADAFLLLMLGAAGVTMAGSGVLGSAAVQLPGVTMAGSGALSAPAAQIQPAGALLSGSGSMSAGVRQGPGVSAGGTGALTGAQAQGPPAALSGSGALAAGLSWLLAAALSGTGVLGTHLAQAPGALLGGSGALTAPAVSGSGVLMSGAGALAAGAAAGQGVHVSGAGTLAVPVLQGPGAVLSGAGALSAAIGTSGNTSLAGTGTLTASAVAGLAVRAVLSGTGVLLSATTARTVIYDSDTCTATDSGFAFITDSDGCTAADAGETMVLSSADICAAADTPLSAWPSDSDTCTAAEAQWWSGPLADSDACTAADGGEVIQLASAETAAAADTSAPLEVYTYIPLSATGPGGGFEIVWTFPDGSRRPVLSGVVPDGTVARFARELASAKEVRFLSDADSGVISESGESVTEVRVSVVPALEVSVQVSGAAQPREPAGQ